MKCVKPSEVEMQVLSVLWRRGPSTVREVLEEMPDRKERAYTTVLTVLQVMEKKGLVSHTRNRLAHVYAPQVTQRQVTGPLLRGLLRTVFGGQPSVVVQNLLADGEVSDEELDAIRKLLDEHKRGGTRKEKRK